MKKNHSVIWIQSDFLWRSNTNINSFDTVSMMSKWKKELLKKNELSKRNQKQRFSSSFSFISFSCFLRLTLSNRLASHPEKIRSQIPSRFSMFFVWDLLPLTHTSAHIISLRFFLLVAGVMVSFPAYDRNDPGSNPIGDRWISIKGSFHTLFRLQKNDEIFFQSSLFLTLTEPQGANPNQPAGSISGYYFQNFVANTLVP